MESTIYWISKNVGIILLVLTVSGYPSPWDQIGYWAQVLSFKVFPHKQRSYLSCFVEYRSFPIEIMAMENALWIARVVYVKCSHELYGITWEAYKNQERSESKNCMHQIGSLNVIHFLYGASIDSSINYASLQC